MKLLLKCVCATWRLLGLAQEWFSSGMVFVAWRRMVCVLCIFAAACAGFAVSAAATEGGTVLLVSIDGFRWDFFAKAGTPNLDRIAREGVKAKALIPVFPTMTFPAHYSMVTGLATEVEVLRAFGEEPSLASLVRRRDELLSLLAHGP